MQSVQVPRLLWISTALICQEIVVGPFPIVEGLATIELTKHIMNGHQNDHTGNKKHTLLHIVYELRVCYFATESRRTN